jgi:hypothetical protein
VTGRNRSSPIVKANHFPRFTFNRTPCPSIGIVKYINLTLFQCTFPILFFDFNRPQRCLNLVRACGSNARLLSHLYWCIYTLSHPQRQIFFEAPPSRRLISTKTDTVIQGVSFHQKGICPPLCGERGDSFTFGMSITIQARQCDANSRVL